MEDKKCFKIENDKKQNSSRKPFPSLDHPNINLIINNIESDKENSFPSQSQPPDSHVLSLENQTININDLLPSKPPILSLAPMLKVTTPNFRKLISIISPATILFTEMIADNTIINKDNDYIINKIGHPSTNTVVQLGGSDPQKILLAVQKCKLLGHRNFNLNCGCPSTKVKKGCFGAILMKNVQSIINIVNYTYQHTNTILSIKCRIGVDEHDTYSWFKNFVSQIYCNTPCKTFFIHARKCWLNGISPKDNRNIPQLKYQYLYQLKTECPNIQIHLNGNIKVFHDIHKIYNLDGLMIGRAAVKNVFIFKEIEEYITYYNKEKDSSKENNSKDNNSRSKDSRSTDNSKENSSKYNSSSKENNSRSKENSSKDNDSRSKDSSKDNSSSKENNNTKFNTIDINSNTSIDKNNTAFIKEVFIKYIKSFNCNDKITNNLIQPIINLRYGLNRNKEYKNILNTLVIKKAKISDILDIIDKYF